MKLRGWPHRARSSRSRWGLRVLPLGVVVALAVAGVGAAEGGFTAGIRNPSSASGTGSLQLSAAVGGTTECATTIASPSASCTGTVVSNALASGAASQSVATTLTATGSLTPASTTLTEGSCAPIPLANSTVASDPLLIRAGVTDATASTFGDGAGITLDGTTGYAAESNITTTVPGNTSEAIWFKASGTAGGTLLGFAGAPAVNNPGNWDRMLWVDNAGRVVFGVYNGTAAEVTSPVGTSYLDGRWHLAVGTISSVLAGGQTLYVDGKQVASAGLVSSAQSYNGYWHVGWDNENNGWADPPTQPYFAGSLTDADIFPMLTAAQVATLYAATSQATWNTDIAGGNGVPAATSAWQLGDPPTGRYTGTPAWLTPAGCSLVDATVQVAGTTTACIRPAAPAACVAPTSGVTLASLSGAALSLTNPTPAQAVTVAVTTARDGTATTAAYPNLAGLHLNLSETLTAVAGSFTATLTWPAIQNVVL